jgi:hypothetical protein
MNPYANPQTRGDAGRAPLPAYGPLDALLSYVVFYIFVDRATPTVVDVVTTALPDTSPSLVQLGLAGALWFIFAVTLLEQLRRQLAALGVGSREGVSRAEGSRATPTDRQVLGYVVVLLVGGIVAVWTFEPAIQAGLGLIRGVATLDGTAFVPREFVLMVVFFVSFGTATRALDRLVIGGIRRLSLA